MAELRQRKTDGTPEVKTNPSDSTPTPPSKKPSVSVSDVLRILGGLLLLNCALSYFITNDSVAWGWRPWFSKPGAVKAFFKGPVRLTDAELTAYDGTDPTKPIYVALNGTIYDVTAGAHVYGPGGSYSFFAGHDAARAFITGCFDTDITPDLRGVEMTYMPRDPDEDPMVLPTVGEGAVKRTAEEKTRFEREMRLAKKKVADGIEGWAKMFRGEGGKPYFRVGEVVREEGWLEKRPVHPLCDRAKKQRPKRKPGQ